MDFDQVTSLLINLPVKLSIQYHIQSIQIVISNTTYRRRRFNSLILQQLKINWFLEPSTESHAKLTRPSKSALSHDDALAHRLPS